MLQKLLLQSRHLTASISPNAHPKPLNPKPLNPKPKTLNPNIEVPKQTEHFNLATVRDCDFPNLHGFRV